MVPGETIAGMSPSNAQKREAARSADRKTRKWSTVVNLLGWALALASWGYSVIAPEPNFLIGTSLLGLALLLVGLATSLAFEMKRFGTAVVVVMFLCAFAVFDYKVLFVPQRGKEATALLTQGYHIVDECSMRPYHDDDPAWMTDEQQKWVGAVGGFVETKMAIEYQQIWAGAKFVGLVSDKDMNGFRCTDMSALGKCYEITFPFYNVFGYPGWYG